VVRGAFAAGEPPSPQPAARQSVAARAMHAARIATARRRAGREQPALS